MDMDPVFLVRANELFRQNVVVDEVLGTFRAELEHDTHRSVGVDVGVVALEVNVHRIGKDIRNVVPRRKN